MENIEIIAECEINHNGDVNIGKKLIDAAAKAGANSVKFQCFKPTGFIAPGSSFMPLFENVELSLDDFKQLYSHAKKLGIEFFCTAVDKDGLKIIEALDLPIIKIGSTNITNIGLLEAIAATGKPVYLSTGASTLGEIEKALSIISTGTNQVTLFHCTALYPAPAEQMNMLSIETLQHAFPDVKIGYSDHSTSNTAAIMATALGVSVLEKHFTLDNNMEGPDHQFSANPDDLAVYVNVVREAETMRGQHGKVPSAGEGPIRLAGRRYITTTQVIPTGAVLSEDNIRPRRIMVDSVDVGLLLEPKEEGLILGWKAAKEIPADTSIKWSDLTPT